MPTIALVQPKGGTGKTTSAIILGTELAGRGAAVTLIDADPNKPVSDWAKMPGRPDNLTVLGEITEENIIEEIESAAQKTPFVIVDLEGTASMTVAYAVSRADLVIIPVQGSHLDAKQATRAIKLIQQQERAFGKKSLTLFCSAGRVRPFVRARCSTSKANSRSIASRPSRSICTNATPSRRSSPSAARCKT